MNLRCFIVGCCLFAAPTYADDTFPYPAVVTSDTDARCGPGSHYYPTSRLAKGHRLEVYRKEGTWVAVRPPTGSFSWVPAAQLATTSTDGVMIANTDDVRVWIGTSLEQLNKHHFQVELRKGEPVEVIGEKQLIAPSGAVADTWYKVAPPAGEFRWVPLTSIQRDEGQNITATDDGAVAPALLSETRGTRFTKPSELERVGDVAPTPAPVPPPTDGAKLVKPAPKPEWLAWQAPTDPIEFDRVLEKLDTDVSRLVAQPANTWDLTEHRIKAAKLADGGPSALHRGKARKLLSSIEQFMAVAARLTNPKPADGSSVFSTPDDDASDANFAGQGWLMPVHSTNASVPKYAVIDDNGRFLQFVSPAPGLNLRRYEKKRVGVIGPSSYIPTLDMPHITAQRVVVMR